MAGNTITPISAEPFSLPLPLYGTIKLGDFTSRDGEEFSMWIGADQVVVDELKEKSFDGADDEIQNNTSDRERFGEGSYEEWYSKDRTPFALVHESGALAAFVWFGPKPLGRPSLKYLSDEERANEFTQKEDVWHTLVYRSYLPFRGKGIMGDFVRFCIEKYKEQYPESKLWVGMSAANGASAALAAKLGFTPREDLFDAEKNWTAMTLE
jgi:RimJ/RimL family protein N-acetyltransferase